MNINANLKELTQLAQESVIKQIARKSPKKAETYYNHLSIGKKLPVVKFALILKEVAHEIKNREDEASYLGYRQFWPERHPEDKRKQYASLHKKHWELKETFNQLKAKLKGIDGFFTRYAEQLLEDENIITKVDLFKYATDKTYQSLISAVEKPTLAGSDGGTKVTRRETKKLAEYIGALAGSDAIHLLLTNVANSLEYLTTHGGVPNVRDLHLIKTM